MTETLIERYAAVRQRTEKLCEPLCIEDYVPQAVEFASPPKWHLAHVTWFFETMILKEYADDYSVFDREFNFLFNSYYQTIGDMAVRNQRGVITRPTVEQVYQYRKYVDRHMAILLEDELDQSLSELVELGLQHEQQHQELLLTDLKYVLALNPISPVYKSDYCLVGNHNEASGWLEVEAGNYQVGFEGDGFSFDNELGRHQVYLQGFEIARDLVTNKAYLEFIEDGGYRNFSFWLDEGWAWVQQNQVSHPLYWQTREGEWFYYTLAGLKEIDPDAIACHLNYYEADAFARWSGHRLPTEFEWEIAAPQLKWGKRWEWTSSAYQAYPGFAPTADAVGEYNGKFMINQWVLRGASVATSPQHSRISYRNFFHPKMQWQFSGVRLAK